MSELKEIKRREVGTGLLIESDGFISMEKGENRKLYEDHKLRESQEEGFSCPYPFIVSAVFQKYGIENANGRIYPESILKREVEKYMKRIQDRNAIGELNHPEESVIDLRSVAMNIVELHWEGHTLVGKLEVVTSPGFRKYGICSTVGDQAANLLLNGIKVGVSSRGLGTVKNSMGSLYVQDDYEIVCWDFVSEPSTPNAWVERNEENLVPYIEGKDNSDKNTLSERLSRFDDWLKLND